MALFVNQLVAIAIDTTQVQLQSGSSQLQDQSSASQIPSVENLAPRKPKGRPRRVNQGEYDVIVNFEPTEQQLETQRQAKLEETVQQRAKAANKVREKLEKLETRKQVAATIIRDNNNRFAPGK